MNRKFVSLLIGLVVWLMVSLVGQAESKEVEIRWNGEWLELEQTAYLVKGSVLAPVRETFATIGAAVSWDEKTRTVTAKKGTKTLVLHVGKKAALLNGKTIKLPAPIQLAQGRAIAPVRSIAEAFDAKVEWVPLDQTVYISEAGKVSIQQAEQLVRDHIGIAKNSDTVIEFDHMEEGAYTIHVYDLVDEHTATRGWYLVEVETGKVTSMF
ncbi:copper amine oxidase N-terminal domain-containing protein [Ammoniphilus sp. 3BR4]|uniref:copper amine oxidase N-terminal domain-containing protein n=1 Tax=Ammoniphilus sp. 3BR4 TaxID=3158265 RepID=UPI003465C3A8